ncbi:MAG: aminotransferase class V-fold PLP-dependent enzyme [Bacteroidota bacterium]
MNQKVIYLDYNATTPVDQRVLNEMIPYFTEKYGNASSIQHPYGWDAEEAVDISREKVARLIGAKAHEIVFTSGATEAINLALFGLVDKNPFKNHIITCETEHKAMLGACKELKLRGISVTYLKVDNSGNINLKELESEITDQTLLVSIMHANNEIGVIHPIEKMAKITHQCGAFFMTDFTQSVGKIPFDVRKVDLAVMSAHKIYGPKGIGALYMKRSANVEIASKVFRRGHERGYLSGTLNVPGIVGFGKACELCQDEMNVDSDRLGKLRDALESELNQLEGTQINSSDKRLPHMTNISFYDIDGSKLLPSLRGLAVSQGSACTSSTLEPSHVLKAVGLSDDLAFSSLRIGLGRFTTEDEIEQTAQIIKNAVARLRIQPS